MKKDTSKINDIHKLIDKKQITIHKDEQSLKQPVAIPVKQDNKNKQTAVIDDIRRNLGNEETDHSKVSTLLMNEKYKRRKTILLDKKQVGLITTLDVIAQIYDIPFLKKYVDWYAEWMTSLGGGGRKDVVDISKFRFAENQKMQNQLLELVGRR